MTRRHRLHPTIADVDQHNEPYLQGLTAHERKDCEDLVSLLLGEGRTRKEVVASITALVARLEHGREWMAREKVKTILSHMRRDKQISSEGRSLFIQKFADIFSLTHRLDTINADHLATKEREERLSRPLYFRDDEAAAVKK